MDTLTHALSGALLARATWNRNNTEISLRTRTWLGFIAGAFPDIDYVLRLVNDNQLFYLNYHRGITHSLLMLPLWALMLAFIFSRLMRPASNWRSLYLVCCLALGIHIAGDMITSYGTKVLSPVSDMRVWLDTTFIIDPYFTSIIVISLLVSVTTASARLYASAGLVVLCSYVGLQYWAHERAIDIGQQAASENWWHDASVDAIPQPMSPFNWKIIIRHEQHYHTARVRLFGAAPASGEGDGFFHALASAYQASSDIQWTRHHRYGADRYRADSIRQAWSSDANTGFREFARFPALLESMVDTGSQCYWFSDLRFMLPHRQHIDLFTYGLCPALSPTDYRLINRAWTAYGD